MQGDQSNAQGDQSNDQGDQSNSQTQTDANTDTNTDTNTDNDSYANSNDLENRQDQVRVSEGAQEEQLLLLRC